MARDEEYTPEELALLAEDRQLEALANQFVGDEGGVDDDPAAAAIREEDARLNAAARSLSGGIDESGFRDGFNELADHIAQAADLYPHDSLAQESFIRQREQETPTAAGVPATMADVLAGAPPSAYKGLLGNTVGITQGQDPQPCGQWMADKDAETRAVGIAFGPTGGLGVYAAAATMNPIPSIRPFIRIQFGNARGYQTIDIDVGVGGVVILPAGKIALFVGLDSGTAPTGAGQWAITVNKNFTYNLTTIIALANANTSRSSNLRRTSYIDNQGTGAGNAVALVVPTFATQILNFVRSDITAQYTLHFESLDGIFTWDLVVQPNQQLSGFPIDLPGETLTVLVTNQGNAQGSCRLVWGLAP